MPVALGISARVESGLRRPARETYACAVDVEALMHRLARFWGRTWKPIVASALVMLVFACGGGGCSGCAGCGISPIPGAFPVAQRIPNSAQVRLTSGGIDFLESNITPIITTVLGAGLDFPVHTMTVSAGISVTICDDDHCSAHIDIESVDITPTPPNSLVVHVRAILHSRHGRCVPGTPGCDITTFTNGSWPGTCDIGLDTTRGSRDFVGVTATLLLRNITGHPARDGYTELVVQSVVLTSGEDVESADLSISGGFLGACGLLNLDFIKNLVIGQLAGQISGLLNGAIGDNLCTTVGAGGTCPTGTFPDGPTTDPTTVCRYGPTHGDTCVPMLLGMDGRGDLGGQFLGGFSPGTHAPIQLVLAAGGDGIATNNGMTVDMVGGFMSMDRMFTTSPGHNSCVPRIDPPTPFPPVIAQAPAFEGNVIPGTTTPAHLGIGIAEDYLNYAGYGMFDSGMLCIGTGTRLSQQLSTGLVSALVRSVGALTFPDTNAALAISVRPQLPPTFDIGTDSSSPLLSITLPHAMIDFYVWSTERYVRFMTYQTDLVIEMNLTVAGGMITPEIIGVTPTNSVVTNSELLSESPAMLASTLETVIQMFAGMFTSGISPIALPAIMGFNLDIPPEGILGVSSGGDDFLSIWANLSLAPETRSVDTSLELSDLVLSPESMVVEHWGESQNTLWLHFASEGTDASERVEYQYRIDQGPWSRWTQDQRIQIDDDVLLLQARHQIEARSRIVGAPRSVDATPAMATIVVDTLAPNVSLSRSPNGMVATGDDIISQGDLDYRFRVDGGAWSPWSTQDEVALDAAALAQERLVVEVEARDEVGNVGTAREALIRGLPNPASGSGCGCRATGAEGGHEGMGVGLGALALGLFVARRRRASAGRKEKV